MNKKLKEIVSLAMTAAICFTMVTPTMSYAATSDCEHKVFALGEQDVVETYLHRYLLPVDLNGDGEDEWIPAYCTVTETITYSPVWVCSVNILTYGEDCQYWKKMDETKAVPQGEVHSKWDECQKYPLED